MAYMFSFYKGLVGITAEKSKAMKSTLVNLNLLISVLLMYYSYLVEANSAVFSVYG